MTFLAALSIAKRFWWVAPLVAVGILFAMWRGAEREADAYEARWKAEQLAHAVTRGSVDRLQAAVNADNAEDEARAAAYRDSLAQAATARRDAERAFASSQARIDALRAAAGNSAPSGCATPDDVAGALEGL